MIKVFYYNIMERIPNDIIDEIGLNNAKKLLKTVTLIQDIKHTGQFSVKIPLEFIENVGWKAGYKLSIEVETDSLKFTKAQD